MIRSWLPFLPIAGATVALFWVVPEPPFAHLDDPSHWGVLGYGLTIVLLVAGRIAGHGRRWRTERHLLVAFLVAMPVIYLAAWVRFGGAGVWLGVEALGAAAYWALAWLGAVRSPWFLAVGIAGHALWDVWHLGTVTYVPQWYALACGIIDPPVGLYVALRLRGTSRRAAGG